MVEQQYQQHQAEDEINLLEYWYVIWKHKILLGIIFFTSVAGALIFCLLSPKIYQSTASILTPAETSDDLMSNLGSAANLAQAAGISIPSLTQNRDIYLSILKSRTMKDYIITRFKLKEYYGKLYIEDVLECLDDITNISETEEEGAISITVEDKNPQMAADIANTYVDYLDRLVAQFGTGAASRQRHFIAEQLLKTESNLQAAEEALKQFKEKHRTIALEEQARGAIEAGATLKGEIMAAEVQLQVMQDFAKANHPEVIKLKRRIEELKHQLAKSQYSSGLDLPSSTNNPNHYQKEIYLPVANVPQVTLELVRLMRNVKIEETLYTFLKQELEEAKIAEVKDTPSVQILDRAVPAEKKSKPKTRIFIAVAGFMSLILGIFGIFSKEYLEKQRLKIAESVEINQRKSMANV